MLDMRMLNLLISVSADGLVPAVTVMTTKLQTYVFSSVFSHHDFYFPFVALMTSFKLADEILWISWHF